MYSYIRPLMSFNTIQWTCERTVGFSSVILMAKTTDVVARSALSFRALRISFVRPFVRSRIIITFCEGDMDPVTGVSQIPSMSNFRKVDPKQISGYKVDPKKWIPKKLVGTKWIPKSGSQQN